MIKSEHLILIIILWNIITFIIYGIDKRKAIKGKWRISESTLLSCAFFMGSVGAFFGMRIFNHKTKKMKFNIGVPIGFIINLVICFIYFYLKN